MAVVYLVFNEGYAATAGDALVRADLCSEAIRLGAPARASCCRPSAEARGLLALMLLHDARRDTRTDAGRRARAARGSGPHALGPRRRSTRARRSPRGALRDGAGRRLRAAGRDRRRARAAPGAPPTPTGGRSRRSTPCSVRAPTRRRWSSSTAPSRSRWPRARAPACALAAIKAGGDLDGYYLLLGRRGRPAAPARPPRRGRASLPARRSSSCARAGAALPRATAAPRSSSTDAQAGLSYEPAESRQRASSTRRAFNRRCHGWRSVIRVIRGFLRSPVLIAPAARARRCAGCSPACRSGIPSTRRWRCSTAARRAETAGPAAAGRDPAGRCRAA